jgi:hypothetical protein
MKINELPQFNTMQDVFEFGVRKLVEQGKKSEYPNSGNLPDCQYRIVNTDEQLSCFFGHIIPDELYLESFEEYPFYLLLSGTHSDTKHLIEWCKTQPAFNDLFAEDATFSCCYKLIRDMQVFLHDKYKGLFNDMVYINYVRDFAIKHSLNTLFLTDLETGLLEKQRTT